jgi:hypothetical protein
MLSMPPELWGPYAEGDKKSRELIDNRGILRDYEGLLAVADPSIPGRISQETFNEQYEACQAAIAKLSDEIHKAAPDVLVTVGDDQDELFFDDNMPALSVYWGETMKLIPRNRPNAPEPIKAAQWGYGSQELDVPIQSDLAKHLIESLIDDEFDVAHSRYMLEGNQYGGTIGPAGYVTRTRTTPTRRQGMIHAYGFLVERLLHNNPIPMVPVTINTCYPPNQITPRRCYKLGQAIRKAVESWDADKKVCVIGTGGLSHFVVDEELDRRALEGMREKDAEVLMSLPRERLNSASSEIRNWVTAAGACEQLDFELIDYVPVYRTPAGTGGGWAFATWQ